MGMTTRICVALEPDLKERARQAADRQGVNLSEFIRDAIAARTEPR